MKKTNIIILVRLDFQVWGEGGEWQDEGGEGGEWQDERGEGGKGEGKWKI